MIKPQLNKIEATQNWPYPTKKGQIYVYCVPNFAPLTDPAKESGPVTIHWTPDHCVLLCQQQVLIAANFKRRPMFQTRVVQICDKMYVVLLIYVFAPQCTPKLTEHMACF